MRCCRLRGLFVITTAAALALSMRPAAAELEGYKLEAGQSTVQFQVSHLFGKVAGQFHDVRGLLRVDRDKPENSSVAATLRGDNIDTQNRTRDRHLRTELFETAKFPEITFHSTRVKRSSHNEADVTGDLTMHGVTKSFLLHVTLVDGAETEKREKTSRWRATGTLKRRDFGLTWSKAVEAVSMIGDDVAVTIDAVAVASR